jgi:uncharacterized membrane protein
MSVPARQNPLLPGAFQNKAIRGIIMTASTAATSYKYTLLDIPGAVGHNAAYGINDFGQTVGGYTVADGTGYGFLDVNGRFTTISVSGASDTMAQGINNIGQIVGFYEAPSGANQGFVDNFGTITTVDAPNAESTLLSGINDPGQIVGTASDSTGEHGFLDNGGTFTSIAVPGAVVTTANAINDLGEIVGNYIVNQSEPSLGFVLKHGVYTTISVPNGVNVVPTGINNLGQIVGIYDDTATQSTREFLDSNGVVQTFDAPGYVEGINDLGQVAGGLPYAFTGTPTNAAACLGHLLQDIFGSIAERNSLFPLPDWFSGHSQADQGGTGTTYHGSSPTAFGGLIGTETSTALAILHKLFA